MEKNFWVQRWQAGQIGFHEGRPNDLLLELAPRLVDHRRVLVPLCGKAIDLVHLAQAGHDVIGVEIVPEAVAQFFADQQLTPTVQTRGAFVAHHATLGAGSVTILHGDVFALDEHATNGPVDALYDRAALVALEPSTRTRYVELCARLVRPGGAIVVVTLQYDQSRIDGPPWSVSPDDVARLYGPSFVMTLHRTQASSTRRGDATVDESAWFGQRKETV